MFREPLTEREKTLYQYKWFLEPATRLKLEHFYLKVWNGSYFSRRVDLNGFIEDEGIVYRVRSKYTVEELRNAREVGLSFRCLTGNSGYVIIKPWSKESPTKDSENEHTYS